MLSRAFGFPSEELLLEEDVLPVRVSRPFFFCSFRTFRCTLSSAERVVSSDSSDDIVLIRMVTSKPESIEVWLLNKLLISSTDYE